ncbi:hypothetical protein LTR04_002038 [Oleoguttula sp. CCFEE 6159]|nr:hypothetical protein LTR04_002038 [Oleoguttula sp. CCFEE 6159]
MSAHGRPSRSPSPNKQHVYSTSPRSLPFTTPRASADGPLIGGPPGRRQSWQPGRKTVKELEAEYHDSDEDVPEDAVIWNVPISPLPPFERTPPRSPPRRSPLAPFEMDSFGNRGQRISPPGARLRSQNTSPQSSLRPNLVHSNTIAGVPGSRTSSVSRTQSWTAELSEEARDLTQALEAHAEAYERRRESAPAPRPSLDKHRAKTMLVELPPVRKGNVMIDPLPISKEKEKVLTRTRPSWLPPKSQREEKKHLKEYQRMMTLSLEAEKRRAPKLREEERTRDETQVSISRIWEQHVLPNWDAVVKEPRTRELWWRGITPRSRGTVWQKAIGNELGLAESSYNLALTRAKELDRRISALGTEEQTRVKEAPWFAAIRRDSSATFPELRIFQPGGPLHDALLDVLMAYAMYRADIGYVYGTHTIAGLLLLNLSPAASFIALANVFNRPMPLAFLVHDVGAIGRTHALALNTLRHKLPALHAHLTTALKDQLGPEDWLDPLFRTLFTHRVPVDVASRVWDVFVFEGDKALVRAAVAVLGALESRLYGSRAEVLELLGWEGHVWDLREEEFMAVARGAGKADKGTA